MSHVRLSRLAAFVNGYAFKPDDLRGTSTPVVRIRQLIDSATDPDKTDLDPGPRYRINTGDLIFAWSGTLAVRTWHRGPALLNQHLFRVDPVAGVERAWLAYALEHSLSEARRFMHGSAMTHITRGVLDQIAVPLPGGPKQRAIAKLLDAETTRIDAVVTARTRQRQLVLERQTALVAGVVAAAGPQARLASVITSIEQGTSPQCSDRPAGPGERGVLKLSAVSARGFSQGQNKSLADDAYDARAVVRDGDLLVTRANTPTLVGLAAVARFIDHDVTLLLPDLIYRLRLRDGQDPDYVQLAMSTPAARGQLTAAARGSSQSMVKLRGEDLRELRIPLPAIERQQAIASKARTQGVGVQRALVAIDRQITLLCERRQALITAAVTGKLDVG